MPAFTFDPAALLPYVGIGLLAQLVDGALGMAFGLISSTLLIWLGVAPAAASAGVHLVEVFTTAASGISHAAQRNVDWRLFLRVGVPGMIGGALGAYALSNVDAAVARPFIQVYLCAVGGYLLWRAWRGQAKRRPPRIVEPLGLVGGFLDAAGGGGWGPVVTSNLLVQGGTPRYVIGTVSASEFFLTLTISAAFASQLGLAALTEVTAGLLIGGVAGAPFGALIARRVPARRLLLFVGLVLTGTSLAGLLHLARG